MILINDLNVNFRYNEKCHKSKYFCKLLLKIGRSKIHNHPNLANCKS